MMHTAWCVCCVLAFVLDVTDSSSIPYMIEINTTSFIYNTMDEYLSFTLDPFLLHDLPTRWGKFKFNHPRVQTLAAGLAPALLRYGGTDADWQTFNDSASNGQSDKLFRPKLNRLYWKPFQKYQNRVAEPNDHFTVTLLPEDVDNLRNLAVTAGGKLVFDLNLQLRNGTEWDSQNAQSLMDYIEQKGYASDVDFELGNEPQLQRARLKGDRIGKDYVILKNILRHRTLFRDSSVVGPALIVFGTTQPWNSLLTDFLQAVQNNLTAVTVHHYYFSGIGASVDEFIDLKYFNSLKPTLKAVRKLVRNTVGSKMELWIGETSDAHSYGAPNISDRFANGFLWLDKLGVAAREGFSLVARQIFYGGNYSLVNTTLQPTPDYWLSHVFKKLVGTRVLDVGVLTNSTEPVYVRAYAHCTTSSPRSAYAAGSVTVFALNLHKTSEARLALKSPLSHRHIDVYLLSPVGPDKLLSHHVALNGVPLELVNDRTLPKLRPQRQTGDKWIIMPPLTFGFFVVVDAAAKACL